jgi:hypothetical protein
MFSDEEESLRGIIIIAEEKRRFICSGTARGEDLLFSF